MDLPVSQTHHNEPRCGVFLAPRGVILRLVRRYLAISICSLLLTQLAYAIQFSVQVVDLEGNEVVGAGLYLQLNKNDGAAPTNNTSADTHSDTLVNVLQLDRRFTPAVSVVPVGAQVRFVNSDDITHHIYTISGDEQFSFLIRRDESSEPLRFSKPGILALGCNIHDWMGGYLIIADANYWGNTDKKGNWKVDVQEGDYQLIVWHPKLVKELRQTVSVNGATNLRVVLSAGYDASKGQKSVNDFDFLEEY